MKKKSRIGGINLGELKAVAGFLKISKCGKKEELIKSIFAKKFNLKKLNSVLAAKQKHLSTFRKEKNTIFRMLNYLMQFPDALERSNLLASKADRQNDEVYGKQKIYELQDCRTSF